MHPYHGRRRLIIHPPTHPQTALDFLQQDPDRVLSVTYNQDMRSSELLEMTSKVGRQAGARLFFVWDGGWLDAVGASRVRGGEAGFCLDAEM